jgi:ribonuclease HI
MSDKTDT